MMAVAVALATMMWMWSAAAVHATKALVGADKRSRWLAYYAALLAVGLTLQGYLLWWVLPESMLSQGWSLKQLQSVQQTSGVLLAAVSAVAFWRARHLLPVLPVHSIKIASPGKAGQKKRRP